MSRKLKTACLKADMQWGKVLKNFGVDYAFSELDINGIAEKFILGAFQSVHECFCESPSFSAVEENRFYRGLEKITLKFSRKYGRFSDTSAFTSGDLRKINSSVNFRFNVKKIVP